MDEGRIRAGWRILIQILLVSIPLTIIGLSGYYSSGNPTLRVAMTAGPITVLSVVICSRFIDRRKISDLGIDLGNFKWWADFGIGTLAGTISVVSLVLLLKIFGFGDLILSKQWQSGIWSVSGSILMGLFSYLIVGIFEELMRTYQIKNTVEGLTGKKPGLVIAGFLAIILGGFWSVVGHVASGDWFFLIFVFVSGLIYGLYFLWTGRAALAIAAHFAWDFSVSRIFQLGSTSEISLFFVRLTDMPDLLIDPLISLGIVSKLAGFFLVLFWIRIKESKIKIQPDLVERQLSNV